VAVGNLSVFGYFIASRLVSCGPCCGRRVSEVGVGIGVWYCDISVTPSGRLPSSRLRPDLGYESIFSARIVNNHLEQLA